MKFLFSACRKKKRETKPGEILDQVISQSSASANQCLLYKLANYKRGGDLIDAFQKGGQISIEGLIRDQFGPFMYNNGKGQIISRAEFLRWKYSENKEVVIPIEASLSSHDPLGKWKDHKACWQMQYRGSLGESLLHVLIICDTKIHTKLARILLRVFPILAVDVMEGEEYLGASALHLAIAYSNNELVQDLIEAGADVQQRAIGSFFLPRDQQGSKATKQTDYEGLAYLGEYPLAWSACCANESVYNLLIDHGADPDAQDSFGNMILHMVVVCDKLDMFGYALRHPRLPAKNGIVNDTGLTPLTLACKLGRAEVFREMLELSAREFWRYSNITCSGYPLNALDTLLPDGRTNWNSALFIILNGTKEEHLDMLDGGIIQRLLEEKWKTFARNQFLKRLLILFVHLFFLSISVYLRPVTANLSSESIEMRTDRSVSNNEKSDDHDEDRQDDGEDDDMNVKNIARYCSEVATLAGVLSYLFLQLGDEIKNQGLSAFMRQLANAPAKAIFLVSNIMILACIPFRIIGDIDTEEAILVFAVPGSWFLLMFFAGAVRLTGPFVTMIYSMITGDMFTFGIIYLIILFGFSQAFYFLYKGHPQVESTLFSTYPSTWMALFQTTLGDYNYSDLNNTTYPNLAKTVFVIFMIFVPILLLNMLIAMMGNTYAHVIEQSEKEWMKQWAKIVVTLERAVSQTDAQKYLEAYSIPLGVSDDSGYETRGVMVIKSKSKTRAKQRKGAVSNWKRVGKVTLDALKRRGLTGEELRRIMWGRASISSPTKEAKKKVIDKYNFGTATNAVGAECGIGAAVMSVTQDIVLINESTISATTEKSTNKAVAVKDPLRELVLISDDPSKHSQATAFAREAAVSNDFLEVHFETKAPLSKDRPSIVVRSPVATVDLPAKLADKNISNLTTVFQDTKDIVDPQKEKEFLEKLRILEESDSDAMQIDGGPVLGKVSLIRRAKSAVSRTSGDGNVNDKHPLFRGNWMEEREKPTRKAAESDSIDDSETTNDEIPTVDEVKRHMELFHLRRGIPPPSARLRDAPNGKYSKRRPRTARLNKISPSDDDSNDGGKERNGRSRSAKVVLEREYSRHGIAPNPLQPWSTKDLSNMNKILES